MQSCYRTAAVLLMTLIVAAPSQLRAQITVTESYFLDQIGEVHQMAEYVTDDGAALQDAADADGPDGVYDFRDATYTDTLTGSISYYGSPKDLPGGPEFAAANYVLELDLSSETDDSTAWIYGRLEEEALYTLGGSFIMRDPQTGERDTLTFQYDPRTRELLLPLTYGAEWTDTTSFFGFETIETRRVDGYGTLQTPEGSAQALRVMVESVQEDVFGVPTTSYAIEFITLNGLSAYLDLDEDGETVVSGMFYSWNASSVALESPELPDGLKLDHNYPDPFNPATRIAFELDAPAHVRLTVYDVLGRTVAVLEDEIRSSGRHEARFDATGLPSGTYFYRLDAGGRVVTRSMTLIR